MTKHILVPLDGSAQAEQVLPHAEALADAIDGTLVIAQVVAPPQAYLDWQGIALIPPMLEPEWRHQPTGTRLYLDAVAARLHEKGYATEVHILEGIDVAATLLAFAAAHPKIAYIAMTTHGQSGWRHLLVGSVAEHLLKTTSLPVLLIHAAAPLVRAPQYRRIVVPLDGSRFAEQGLAAALTLVEGHATELLLVGVGASVNNPALAEGGIEPPGAETTMSDNELGTYLRAQSRALTREGYAARAVFVRGLPAEEIFQVAAAEHGDLIVMSTHGRTGVQRWWLGSVAYDLVQITTTPLLLVHPHAAAESGQAVWNQELAESLTL